MTSLGKYDLHEEIGQGGFATVYRASHRLLGTDVAVKVLNPDRLRDPRARERMVFEAKIAAGLKHPNIVDVLDLIQEGDTLAIAMEYIPGGNLKNWVEQNKPGLDQILPIITQIADALDYIHKSRYQSDRPLLHRDVKPENVLIDRDPISGKPKAKLSDFGLVFDPQNADAQGIPGTAYYISPEQVEKLPLDSLDGRTDQYALAVMAYELLTGRRPFEGNDPIAVMTRRLDESPQQPSKLSANLPLEFDEPLLKALSKSPEGRYPTCADFARKLNEAWQASRLRSVRELIEMARSAASAGDFKSARAKLDEAARQEPDDARIHEARKSINVQAELAQRYDEAVQNWQAAKQKAHAVLDLVPDFHDPKGLLVTLGARPAKPAPFDLRGWLQQILFGIIFAVLPTAFLVYIVIVWIVNR